MSTLEAGVQGSRRLFSWWAQELADLVPLALRRWAAQEGKRTIFAVENDGVIHYEDTRGRLVRRTETDLASIEPPSRSAGPVGIRLPRTACLIRRIELPAAARADFDKILQLDLERSTPFRHQDVYCDHLIDEGIGRDGKVSVRQVVVKRDVLDPILQRLAARNIAVAFADCWDESGKQALPINLLRDSESQPGVRRRFPPTLILALCALFLACSTVVIALNKYEAALARLEAETAAAKAKAFATKRSLTGVEASLAEIAELRRLKTAKPPVIRVLDELTRLLPDSAWVSSLKIEGDAIEITIVAPTSGELLSSLGRSSLFSAADLTAPVTYDPAGHSERATVRLTLRPAASSARPARDNETVGSKT
jgi:general secretion pathway protein L